MKADAGCHRPCHALRKPAKFQEAGIRVVGEVKLGKHVQALKSFVVNLELRKVAWLADSEHELTLSQLIPDAPAGAALTEVALFHQGAKMLLERVAISVGQSNRIAHGDASMFACELDDL